MGNDSSKSNDSPDTSHSKSPNDESAGTQGASAEEDDFNSYGTLSRAKSMSNIEGKKTSLTPKSTCEKANAMTVRNVATELPAEPASCKKKNPNKNQEKRNKEKSQKEEEQSKQMKKLYAKLDSQQELINELLRSGIELAAKGKWENSADLTEPKHLATEIQTIYKNEWRNTKKSLIAELQNGNKSAALPTSFLVEFYVIKWLSYILQECHTFCLTKANLPISQFFAALSTNSKLEFDMMRKTVGMRSDVMEGIVQEFLSKWVPEEDQRNGKDDSITDKCESNKVCEEGEICNSVDIINFPSTQGDSKNDGTISCTAIGVTKTSIQKKTDIEDRISGNGEISKESCKSDIGTDSNKIISSYIMDLKSNDECLKQFQKYVTACTNACWKAVISYPPVHLQFNLTGKNFKDVDEKYGLKKYTLNMPYRDTSKIHDEIALVVWPPSITYEYGGHEENVLATKNARVVVNFLDEC